MKTTFEPNRAPLPVRKKAALAAITFLMFFGVIEAGVRLIIPHFPGSDFPTSSARSMWAEQGWAFDSSLNWKLPANDARARGSHVYQTNSVGLATPEFSQRKAANTLRVLAIGDSTVMGWGVKQNKVFTRLLEERLGTQLEQQVEVINSGVPGYSSEQARIYLESEGLELEPDVVVFQASFNDRRAIAPGAEPDSREYFQSLARRLALYELANKSATAQLLRSLLPSDTLGFLSSGSFAFHEIPVNSNPRVSLERYEENIRAIVSLTRNIDAQVILVGLQDNPVMYKELIRARDLIDQGKWAAAERELTTPLWNPTQVLLAQKMLNEVLAATGRSNEIASSVQAILARKDTAGFTPVELSNRYLFTLNRVGAELGVPVIYPKSPNPSVPDKIYRDEVHLNNLGHRLLAAALSREINDFVSTRVTASTATSVPRSKPAKHTPRPFVRYGS
ncbi:MAG: lysophospholipase L1-like esterase [Myxococcota bacterium]|jgi:lysophospholipase L1-like esterase